MIKKLIIAASLFASTGSAFAAGTANVNYTITPTITLTGSPTFNLDSAIPLGTDGHVVSAPVSATATSGAFILTSNAGTAKLSTTSLNGSNQLELKSANTSNAHKILLSSISLSDGTSLDLPLTASSATTVGTAALTLNRLKFTPSDNAGSSPLAADTYSGTLTVTATAS